MDHVSGWSKNTGLNAELRSKPQFMSQSGPTKQQIMSQPILTARALMLISDPFLFINLHRLCTLETDEEPFMKAALTHRLLQPEGERGFRTRTAGQAETYLNARGAVKSA